MKYKVTLAGYVICHIHPDEIGPIPNTDQEIILDINKEMGREIWWGYLMMRENQKKTGIKAGYQFAGIELSENDPEIDKFREAINLFCRFMAGEGRDNCNRVRKIEKIS